jgi:parallel beta-helix repeat protein
MLRRVGLFFAIALVVASVFASGTAVAASGTLWVNDDNGPWFPPGTSCDHPGFQTIQSAVDAAPPGARINVCPGTYVEEVFIAAGKDSIQLRSVKTWQAVIKAPALMLGPTKSIVRVNGAQNVTILAFTIAGPGGFGCDSLRYGVRVDNGGSAEVLGNHIVDIRDEPFSGCQNGVAVLVGRQAETQTGSARIIGNVIERYQKNGPTVSNAGSSAVIAHNRVLGVGPTTLIAQNGIQVSAGALADVQHNFVSGNVYSPATVSSTGILLFQAGATRVAHNTITSNDVGEYTFDTNAASTISQNRVRASSTDGLVVQLSSQQQVEKNKAERNAGPGIGVYAADDNTLNDNHVKDNVDSGIFVGDTSTNNTVSDNKVRDNGTDSSDSTDGIRVEAASTGNTFDGNKLRDNLTHDCHDFNASGDNTWTHNRGETSEPPNICGKDGDDADFAESTTYGWDASYPWYLGIADAGDYDWAAAYATVDTDALLQLVAQLGLGGGHRRATPYN